MIHIYKMKKAFTMIELVFAIVVIGILASLAMPRIDRDLMNEAATNILSDIRYTQHLALMDNKHLSIKTGANPEQWQRRFWRIIFSSCSKGAYYMVGSDDDMSGADNALFTQAESAIDPANSKRMFGDSGLCGTDGGTGISDRMFITHKYGVKAVTSSGGCNGAKHIAFDYFGRPYHGKDFASSTEPNNGGYMKNNCNFTFTMSDDKNLTITIQAETGYASINGQPDS